MDLTQKIVKWNAASRGFLWQFSLSYTLSQPRTKSLKANSYSTLFHITLNEWSKISLHRRSDHQMLLNIGNRPARKYAQIHCPSDHASWGSERSDCRMLYNAVLEDSSMYAWLHVCRSQIIGLLNPRTLSVSPEQQQSPFGGLYISTMLGTRLSANSTRRTKSSDFGTAYGWRSRPRLDSAADMDYAADATITLTLKCVSSLPTVYLIKLGSRKTT